MKRTVIISLALLLMASNLWAAPIRSYVGIQAGAALPAASSVTDAAGNSGDVSYKPGYTVSGVLGHEFGTGLRVEGEVNYSRYELDKIVTKTGTNGLATTAWGLGAFANAYYDLQLSRLYTPYVGGGIGFKSVNLADATANGIRIWNSSHDSVFAYQLGFGNSIRLARDVSLDVGYRYQEHGRSKIDQVSFGVGSQHNVFIGIRYYP